MSLKYDPELECRGGWVGVGWVGPKPVRLVAGRALVPAHRGITQLKAQGPSRSRNESRKDEEDIGETA